MYKSTLYWHFVSENMKTNEVKKLYCLTRYYLGNRIKEKEPCAACGMSSGEGECVQCFGGKAWKKETALNN